VATSGSIIREARLRAGLSQGDLQERSGKDRAQIARWERDEVTPSFEMLRQLIRACGYDLSTELIAYEPAPADRYREVLPLTPHERLVRMMDKRVGGAA
jgi:transcriptional regulator with XRE-family HTH domain